MLTSFQDKTEESEIDERHGNKQPAKKLKGRSQIGYTFPSGGWDLVDRGKVFVHIGPPCQRFDA